MIRCNVVRNKRLNPFSKSKSIFEEYLKMKKEEKKKNQNKMR
jgi:hypothetical protein